MAFFFIPLGTITLSGIPPDKIPAASGLSSCVRITAGSFGTSIATTLRQDRAAMHQAHLSESVNLGSIATNSVLPGLAGAHAEPGTLQQILAAWMNLRPNRALIPSLNAPTPRHCREKTYKPGYLSHAGRFYASAPNALAANGVMR